MDDLQEEAERVANELADRWVRTLDPGSEQSRTDFVRWLKASPLNVRAMLMAVALDQLLNHIDPQRAIDVEAWVREAATNIVPISAQVVSRRDHTPPRPYQWWPWTLAWAAMIVCVVIGLRLAFNATSHDGLEVYETRIGEQRSVTLVDGSTMQLNTGSKVELAFTYGQREVHLIRGEALFTVKHDANRPFRVFTTDATIEDLGTQFDVYRHAAGTRVAVLAGKVRVSRPTPSEGDPIPGQRPSVELLTIRQTVDVSRDGSAPLVVQTLSSEELLRQQAWTEGVINLVGESLRDAVKEINRYHRQQLVIADDELATLPVSGRFRTTDLASFLKWLEFNHHIRVIETPMRGVRADTIRLAK